MRCVQAKKKLQLYIDCCLSLNEIRHLEAHLASCSACCQELRLLEEVSGALDSYASVIEPADLTANIMKRVAQSVGAREQSERDESLRRQSANRELVLAATQSNMLFRLSLQELLAAVLLASVTMLGIILTLPSLRSVLPFTSGHDPISRFTLSLIHMLSTMDAGALMWMFWILGTLLGVCITLALAGNEMRKSWFKAMTDRLPVW